MTLTAACENASYVGSDDTWNTNKLDVSSGDKTIKYINDVENNLEVFLGNRTLTLNGGDNISKFTGVGGSVKKISNDNLAFGGAASTATGTFQHQAGNVSPNNATWAGAYNLQSGTLYIGGNFGIGGNMQIANGTKLDYDLTQPIPSKLNVGGNVQSTGTAVLEAKVNNSGNYTLIQANGGIPNITPYSLVMNPMSYDGILSAPDGSKLLLSVSQATVLGCIEPTGGIQLINNNEQLIIENAENAGTDNLQIYNVSGQQIVNSRLSNHKSINISHLPKGVYLLRIGNYTEKFVKN